MYVCLCAAVSDKEIRELVAKGVCTVAEVMAKHGRGHPLRDLPRGRHRHGRGFVRGASAGGVFAARAGGGANVWRKAFAPPSLERPPRLELGSSGWSS